MEENFRNIYKAIQEADALLIGASNGLSISERFRRFPQQIRDQKHTAGIILSVSYRRI
jgi:hypothetical protein